MKKTEPWTPHLPVWEWEGIPEEVRINARERYEYRSAVIEHDGRQARGPAEMRAYCRLIEVLYDEGVFRTEHISDNDVIRQIHIAEGFRRHDAIGRRIMAGTWKRKDGEVQPRLSPEEII